LRGSIHLRIDDPANPHRRDRRLDQPGTLPLKAHDLFRIEVKLNRPAYLYLFWIGADGRVVPIYPWAPGHWDSRPVHERKLDVLSLPPGAGSAWEIPPGNPGLETLALLVREASPLPRDIDLARRLVGLTAQVNQSLAAAVWLENGQEVAPDPDRAAAGLQTRKSNDPVLRIRRLLQDRLQPLGDYTRAVLFPNQGGP
jgi:hypothetical protein